MTDPQPTASAPSGRRFAALCAVVFLSFYALRWWLVLSGRLVADGDECIVGLMGLHWLHGDPSLYFWGQPYGAGAGVEAALAGLLFKIFSPGAAALKAAGLLVWTGFALTAAFTADRLLGRREAWAMLALVAIFPAVGEWAMKIRGGHFLSLAAFTLALWPAARVWDREAARPLAWSAAAVALLFFSAFMQPTTIVPAAALAAFVFVGVLRKRAWAAAAATALGGAAIVLLALYIAAVPGIKPHSSVEGEWLQAAIKVFAFGFLRFFTPLIDPAKTKIGPLENAAALVWLGASLLATVAAIASARRPGCERAGLLAALVAGAAAFPGAALLSTENLQPRHLFPLYPVFCLFLACGARLRPAWSHAALIVLTLAALGLNWRVATSRSSFSPSTGAMIRQESTDRTLKFLEERGISHVFVADYDFMWNLAFFSREEVIGRNLDPRGRSPAYVRVVNNAADNGRPLAVIFIGQIGYPNGQIVSSMIGEPGVESFRPDPEVFVLTGVPPSLIFKYFLRNEREIRELYRKQGK